MPHKLTITIVIITVIHLLVVASAHCARRALDQAQGPAELEQRGEDVRCQAQRVDDDGGPCRDFVNDTLGLLSCCFADQELIDS